MYKRKSAATGKEIISIFSPDKDRPVFENDYWWSDAWDPLDYGRIPDLTMPLLPQLQALIDSVPVMAMINDQNENSPYINSSGWSKNCHWSWGVDYCDHVFYSESTYHSNGSFDCLFLEKGEKCYECIDCTDCHTAMFCQNARNCHDCYFLFDCIGCSDCFGCVSLRQKKYCFFNEQLSKDEYKKKIAKYLPLTQESIASLKTKHQKLINTLPHCYMNGTNNEDSSGDYLSDSKNAQSCFDSYGLQDCKYCCNTRGADDCLDVSFWGHPGELLYECMAVGEGASRVLFSYLVWGGTENIIYCNTCIGCHDCFGCAGLRKKQYCIFNVQYAKEEYERKVAEVIEAMERSGEWGQFLSLETAPFCYNESIAQVFYPLTKKAVQEQGWQWLERKVEIPEATKIIPAQKLPSNIDDIPDDVLYWAISCERTQRPFKIEKMELEFYRMQKLPLPHLHPEERLWDRWKLRNPRKLWTRECAKCSKSIETTYAPGRPEIVYCEECYLKAVY